MKKIDDLACKQPVTIKKNPSLFRPRLFSTLSDTKLSRRGAIVEASPSSYDEDGDRPGASVILPGELRRV